MLDLSTYHWLMSQQRAGRILPQYDDFCLSRIPDAVRYLFGQRVRSALGVPMAAAGLAPNPKGKVVVLLLDGFGFTQWQRYIDRYEFLRRMTDRGQVTPITSVFPSTTAAALTTMATGETPQQHALLEWLVYEEEIGDLFYTIPFASLRPLPDGESLEGQASPGLMVSGQTFMERLGREGVRSFVLSHEEIYSTIYSRTAYRGASFLPYQDANSMLDGLREGLRRVKGPAYFYVYYERIDKISHRSGPHSDNYLAELDLLFEALRMRLLEAMDPSEAENISIIVTADHGHINIDPTKTIFLNDQPDVLALLRRAHGGRMIPPWGSNRDCFLAIEPGKLDEAHTLLTARFRHDALVLRSDDAIAQGYFGRGTLHPRFRSRAGDLLILPNDTMTIWYQHKPGDRRYSRVGTHGGLTPDEVLVPFASARLTELLG